MPPKRSADQTPSPAKKSRKRGTSERKADGRGTLHAYFGSLSPDKSDRDTTTKISRGASSKILIEIDDDDEFDQQHPSRVGEGSNIDEALAAEQKRKKAAKFAQEVIDIDALDDNSRGSSGIDETLRLEDNLHASSGTTDDRVVVANANSSKMNLAVESHASEGLESSVRMQASGIDQLTYSSLDIEPTGFSVAECPWKGPAPYSFLAYTLHSVSSTRSRISILNILTNALRLIIQHDSLSLLSSMYLLSNSLTPPYVPVELGLGPSIISKAIQHVSGLSAAALRRLYTRTGDPGDVAFEARSNLRTLIPHPALTITGVYKSLLKICHSKGEGATKQKQSIVEKLLLATKGEEARYLVRTLTQHIRVGAVRTSILTALARALVLTRPASHSNLISGSPYFAPHDLLSSIKKTGKGKKKEEDPARSAVQAKFLEAEKVLKQVYVQHPNYDDIAEAIVRVGLEGLADTVQLSVGDSQTPFFVTGNSYQSTLGIPLHHTLGSPTRSLDEVYDRLGDLSFTAEFKYDGQRAQIHAKRSDDGLFVRIFSRHLEEMTDKVSYLSSLS